MKKKLTKRTVDAVKPADKDVFVWDTNLTGFLLKVTPTGRKTFLYQYRNTRGLRRFTIGPMGQWTPDQARTEAGRLAGLVARGEDPQQDKANRRKAGTVNDMLDQFLEEHAKVKTKPGDLC